MCVRHGVKKNEHWWKLCQRRQDYFELWEQGIGPGQVKAGTTTSQSRGLGDTVAKLIKKTTGIKPCGGCKKRQEWLNRMFPYNANKQAAEKRRK
jgi:hypothetical protein